MRTTNATSQMVYPIVNLDLRKFQVFYTLCTTQQHIDFMNMNVPLKASNLNNPCPKLQTIGTYTPGSVLEMFWTDNTSHPEIVFLHHLATQQAVSTALPLQNLITASMKVTWDQELQHFWSLLSAYFKNGEPWNMPPIFNLPSTTNKPTQKGPSPNSQTSTILNMHN